MNPIIGYAFSVAGLAFLLTVTKIHGFLSKYFEIKLPILIVGGIGLILVGIIILMNPSEKTTKALHAKEEVPIYSGEGKRRKIIGYRKD